MKQAMLLALLALFSWHGNACDMHGNEGILPANDMWIGVHDKSAGGITQEQFNTVIDRVSALYSQAVKDQGAELVVEKKWEDGTVNAYAIRRPTEPGIWKIAFFGGLARHETFTVDSFAMVVCHELGHHLGGAPKKVNWTQAALWATNEGQADYWASLKCFRKYAESENNIALMKERNVNSVAKDICAQQFKDQEQQAICQRSAMAGKALATFFKVVMKKPDPVLFNTPSSAEVSTTYHAHPQPQCRLDTYFQGGLCQEDHRLKVSQTDAEVGVCSRKDNVEVGVRPLCWYKPTDL